MNIILSKIPETFNECFGKYFRKECADCALFEIKFCGKIRKELIEVTHENNRKM